MLAVSSAPPTRLPSFLKAFVVLVKCAIHLQQAIPQVALYVCILPLLSNEQCHIKEISTAAFWTLKSKGLTKQNHLLP